MVTTIKLEEQEVLDVRQGLIIVMKELDNTKRGQERNLANRLEKILDKIDREFVDHT